MELPEPNEAVIDRFGAALERQGTGTGDPARNRIDTVAQDGGWKIAAWYTQLKTTAVPTLGRAAAIATTAQPTGGPSGRTAADRRAPRGR